MANINLNQSPYYDDFNPTKDYVRVLFRPGFPVQARELTTLQSFLQEQISRFGDHVFKDGSRVTNAEITLSTDVHKLVLTGTGNLNAPTSGARTGSVISTVANLKGKIITNGKVGTDEVRARVVDQPTGIVDTSQVGNLYIKYLTTKQFATTPDGTVGKEAYIYALKSDNGGTIDYYNTFSSSSPATIANINEGIFYVQGFFTRVAKQSVLVSASSNTPSAQIGFNVSSQIITQNIDSTLYDNARGTSNEGAPGAHRLKQNLTFSVKSVDAASDPNFYRVMTVVNGVIQEVVKRNPEYEELGRTLARRTYDESGDYALAPFPVFIQDAELNTNFEMNIGPSKAYVKGFEVEKSAPTNIVFNRVDETSTRRVNNFRVPVNNLTNVAITSITGILPQMAGIAGDNPFNSSARLILRNSSNAPIGVARAYGIFNTNRLYLYDIKMFQKLTLSGAGLNGLSGHLSGLDIEAGGTRAQVFNETAKSGSTTIGSDGNTVYVVNATNTFVVGTILTSTTNAISAANGKITAVEAYSFKNVSNVISLAPTSGTAFTATITSADSDTRNINGSLLGVIDKHLSNARTSAAVYDNDFISWTTNGTTTGVGANGIWGTQILNDVNQTNKRLKFGYRKITNTSASAAGAIGYGWSAAHREVSLFHPDIHKVYGINVGNTNTNTDFSSARFARITISSTSAVPNFVQGSIIVGSTSKTKAIVALGNLANAQQTQGTHVSETNVGTGNVLEIVFLEGSAFSANEVLTITSPTYVSQADQNNNVSITPTGTKVNFVSVTAATGKDVTGSFLLDNGQRNEFYDIGRLVRKGNHPSPTGDILVFFSYFENEQNNISYYNVDSYDQHPGGFNTLTSKFSHDVRYYSDNQEILPQTTDVGVDLRNAVDFRLKVKTTTSSHISPFDYMNRNFVETQNLISPERSFTFDFFEYLGRTDLIALDTTGNFVVQKGVPSADPKRPNALENGMTIAYIDIPPAVRYINDEIKVDIVDNKRYTMRDIGRIDQRIDRLEEAVSLSMLESQALQDNVSSRTTTGFAVDDFSTIDNESTIADQDHNEYNASIDLIEKRLIPAQTSGVPINVTMSSDATVARIDPFWLSKGWIIKQYTQENMIGQLNSTGAHRINPFATWIYNGIGALTPARDYWRVPVNNYFVRQFGVSRPVSQTEFQRIANITTADPGGRTTTTSQWIGAPRTTTRRRGRTITRTTTRAQRTISRTTFNELRRVSGTSIQTTKSDRALESFPQNYFMRSITISFRVENLRPRTDHTALFGSKQVLASVISDSDGVATGSFVIPPTTHHVGTHNFELKDKTTLGNASFSATSFTAAGHFEHFDINQEVSNQRTVSTTNNVSSSTSFRLPEPERNNDRRGDPIAQTFMLPSALVDETLPIGTSSASGSVQQSSIVSSIDLWFGTVDNRTSLRKVIVQIRETVNGYPGGADKVLGTTGFVNVSPTAGIGENGIPSTTNAVNFRFTKPVKLQADKEYCIVILSPSDTMSVHVATIGESLTNGNGIHDTQPNVGGHFGSFFVSQNQTTWTANQNIDMTFKLYRANFDTNNTGTIPSSVVSFQNQLQDSDYYLGDIAAYSQGLAIETYANSYYVKVIHPNHGLNFNGATVKLSGFEPTVRYNNILGSVLNNSFAAEYATLDSYYIQLPKTSKANANGRPPVPLNVYATQSIIFDSMTTNIGAFQEDTDFVSIDMSTTNSRNTVLETSGNSIRYKNLPNQAVPLVLNTAINVPVDDVFEFENPMVVRNKSNATTAFDLKMNVTLDSTNKYSSPFFLLGGNVNPIAYRNITGTMLEQSQIDSGLTRRTLAGSDSDINTQRQFISYQAGVQSNQEHSAYVTKQIDLITPASIIDVKFDADMEPSSSVEMSYKIRSVGDDTPFENIEWTNFPSNQQVNEARYGAFKSSSDVEQYAGQSGTLPEFNAFKVRLKMKTENEAQIPRVKDLRIIARVVI